MHQLLLPRSNYVRTAELLSWGFAADSPTKQTDVETEMYLQNCLVALNQLSKLNCTVVDPDQSSSRGSTSGGRHVGEGGAKFRSLRYSGCRHPQRGSYRIEDELWTISKDQQKNMIYSPRYQSQLEALGLSG